MYSLSKAKIYQFMVMADSSLDMNTRSQPAGLSFAATVQITIAIALLNFILFVAIFILYLRAKGYLGTNSPLRSRRLVFLEHERTPPRHALDRSILDSLPVTVFRAGSVREGEGPECAVCLCELTDGEKARFLPKCRHGFHVECIDMWFHSNSTCPLCRNPVGADDSMETFVEIPLQDLEVVPDPGHSSDSSGGPSLVIDIPRRMMNGFPFANSPLPFGRMSPNSPLPTSRMPAEVIKSPVLGRIGSLRRILSRGNGEVSSCSTPRACDVEYGGVADSKCNC